MQIYFVLNTFSSMEVFVNNTQSRYYCNTWSDHNRCTISAIHFLCSNRLEFDRRGNVTVNPDFKVVSVRQV